MSPGDRALAFAVTSTRTWTWLYTCGIDRAARDARRAEIDSDLWDALEDARRAEARPIATSLEIMTRLLLGVVDDCLWRIADAPRAVRPPGLRWAATTAAVLLMVAAGAVIVLMAPAKLPVPYAPELAFVAAPPPPPPPPPPRNAFGITTRR